MLALSALQSRAADSTSVCNTDLRSAGDWLITFNTSEVAVCCFTRLRQFAGEGVNLVLEVGSRYVTRRHFGSLGPNRVLALHRPSTSTASLHVAPDGSRRCAILGKSPLSRHGSRGQSKGTGEFASGRKRTF